MKRPIIISSIILVLFSIPFMIVVAQNEEELVLKLRREFGYGGGVDIQGSFSLSVNGPLDLQRVAYYIDGDLMGESVDSPSFRFKFKTDDYPFGLHKLSSTGFRTGGETIVSNTITKNFISATEGYQSAIKILGIILVLILAVSAISYLITTFVGGKNKTRGSVPLGEPRNYGPLGGTVCPKCSRPFSRHIYGLNIAIGKFDRCPHCGKWSVTYRASAGELRAAEQAELELYGDKEKEITPDIDSEERLQKDLEDSRFNDL